MSVNDRSLENNYAAFKLVINYATPAARRGKRRGLEGGGGEED